MKDTQAAEIRTRMHTYEIVNAATGVCLGRYRAHDEDAAHATMLRDAGYTPESAEWAEMLADRDIAINEVSE
jgi:hypothetical protein